MKGFSDGQKFCSLKTGKGHMPLERVRVNDSELWNLVNYVRSLSKGEGSRDGARLGRPADILLLTTSRIVAEPAPRDRHSRHYRLRHRSSLAAVDSPP